VLAASQLEPELARYAFRGVRLLLIRSIAQIKVNDTGLQ